MRLMYKSLREESVCNSTSELENIGNTPSRWELYAIWGHPIGVYRGPSEPPKRLICKSRVNPAGETINPMTSGEARMRLTHERTQVTIDSQCMSKCLRCDL